MIKDHIISKDEISLFICYILFPLTMMISRDYLNIDISRNYIDILWLILLTLGLLRLSIVKKTPYPVFSEPIIYYLITLVIVIKFIIQPFYSLSFNIIPFLMELKPFFYLLVTIIMISAFQPPSQACFVKYGSALSLLVIFSAILESLQSRNISRSIGSGEINYDALLILISLTISVFGDIPRNMKFYTFINFLGLIATYSRTAIFTFATLIFLFSQVRVLTKILILLFSVAFLLMSFYIRELPLNDIESMDRYWMWQSAFEYFDSHPFEFLVGTSPGSPLELLVKSNLEWLWDTQSDSWGIRGVFPFHFHSFWLRVLSTWGCIITAILVAYMVKIIINKKTILQSALFFIILFQGLTMGVFYLSNVSIPLFLALYIAKKEIIYDYY